MFNQKCFLDKDFLQKLLADLVARGYSEEFLQEVKDISNKIETCYQLKRKLQELQQHRNLLIKKGLAQKDKVIVLNKEIKPLEEQIDALEQVIYNTSSNIPNILHTSVPKGKDAQDNVEIFKHGTQKINILPHYDMELIENASDLTCSRFVYLKGQVASLERAIGNFLLNFLIDRGFEEISIPLLLSEESLKCSGHIPKEKENMFYIPDKNLYLIPTSECVLVNLMKNLTCKEEELPKRYTAFNVNFRKEAGAYGKDTKGLIRLHQFPKVEMVAFTKDEATGMRMLEEFVNNGKEVLELLGLPYRILNLCTGDLGFNAQITYDLEVWMAGMNEYREISSISYCGTFQTENLKARWVDKDGNKQLMHSLNGTCLAVGRLLAAIMEYYYEEGRIQIPSVLHKYLNFTFIEIKK